MGIPSPSASQQQSLEQLKAVADAGVTAASDKVAAIETGLVKQQDIEDYQKIRFDALNDDIIGQYEKERKWIDGLAIANPIIENDIQQFANFNQGSRLWNGGDFAPVRIQQFDGGPLTFLETNNELDLFETQNTLLELLQNGLPNQKTLDNGAEILSSINSASTTVKITGNIEPIAVGNVLFCEGGGNFAFMEVTAVRGYCTGEDNPEQTTESTCLADNGTWIQYGEIDFTYKIAPQGTIPAGSPIGQKTFSGFTDAERTTKTANDPSFQKIMDSFLNQLDDNFDRRIIAMQNQINAIDANENDDIDLTAKSNAQDSINAVNGFLGLNPPTTIDISDSGIFDINAERDIRKPQAQQRITDIATEISNGNFYDLRFNTAEGRCRLNNGSIVLLNDLQSAKTKAQEGGVEAGNLSSRYDELI